MEKKVLMGVGGAGCNFIRRSSGKLESLFECFMANTERKVLEKAPAEQRLLLGEGILCGKGSGGDPAVGRAAALESAEAIRNRFQDVQAVYLIAGLGGGTGTGATPEIARMAKEVGVPLVVVLATTSFGFEGPVRRDNSEKGLKRLYETADIVLKLPNERISQMKLASHDFFAAFRKVDEAVCLGIQALEDLFMMPKDLELLEKVKKDNFALDRHIHIGQGSCSGPGRIRAAWFQAKRPFWGECPDSKASSCFARLIHRGELGKEERDEFEKILGAAYPSAEVFRREYVRVDTLKEEVRLTLLTSTVGEPCELNVKPARRMKCLG